MFEQHHWFIAGRGYCRFFWLCRRFSTRGRRAMVRAMMPTQRRNVITYLFAFAAAACMAAFAAPARAQGRGGSNIQNFDTASLSVASRSGRHRFTVEVARSSGQHARGLMFRRRMALDAGMLFLYKRAAPVQMWMKNTLFPLDMIFIAADGRIVRIAERAVPRSLETISSGVPVIAVLELNGGTVSRLKIAVGDRIVHSAFGQSG
jgi:hypothetical protein